MKARIIGTGSYLPEKIVTNDDLAKVVETNDEWIKSRTGICERRVAVSETTLSISTKASQLAIEDAGITSDEIDMIILATITPDTVVPSGACEIQREINAVNAFAFDLNAACSGFVYALKTAEVYIQSGMCKTVLVVGAETLSRILDWSDRSTCVLFGDGAGAAIVRGDEVGMIHTILGSDGFKADVLTCTNRPIINPYVSNEVIGNYISMEGSEVFRFAAKKVPEVISEVLSQSNTPIEEIDWFLLHQANERIIQSIEKRLHIDPDKVPINLDKCGNTSAASVPILLDQMNKSGKIKRHDKLILAGFGGGLTWGATLIEW